MSFAAGLLLADIVTQTWTNTYNSDLNLSDILADIAVDNSGNVYVTGTSFVGSTSDITTIKYNSAGQQQWVRNYDGGSLLNDSANAIAIDASGYIYVAGQSASTTPDLSLCRLIKYNSAGTLQWAITFQGANNTGTNIFSDVETDGSGNIYTIDGCTEKTTGLDYVTVKYNSGGTKVWAATRNSTGTANDTAIAMKLDSSFNVYITGDKGTVKYNNAGVQQWVDSNFPGFGIAADSSSNIYVLSVSNPTICVLKYNSAGARQWSSLYPQPMGTNAYPTGIAVDASGNSYFTGMLSGSGGVNILTVKSDTDGFFLWDAMYDVSAYQYSFPGSIACDQWGNSYTTAIVNRNLMTLKYDSDGYEKWNMIYSANLGGDMPTPIVVKSGEVYVGGDTYSQSTNVN